METLFWLVELVPDILWSLVLGGGGGRNSGPGSKLWAYNGNGSGYNGPTGPGYGAALGKRNGPSLVVGVQAGGGGETSTGWTGGGGGGGWYGGNAGFGTDLGTPSIPEGHGGGGGGSGWLGTTNGADAASGGALSPTSGNDYGSLSSKQDSSIRTNVLSYTGHYIYYQNSVSMVNPNPSGSSINYQEQVYSPQLWGYGRKGEAVYQTLNSAYYSEFTGLVQITY